MGGTAPGGSESATPSGVVAASRARRARSREGDWQVLAPLQTLLNEAVARLARQTGSRRVLAWGFRPEGEAYLAAAFVEDERGLRASPSVDEIAELGVVVPAIDLGGEGASPPAQFMSETHGVCACASLV